MRWSAQRMGWQDTSLLRGGSSPAPACCACSPAPTRSRFKLQRTWAFSNQTQAGIRRGRRCASFMVCQLATGNSA